MLSGSVSGAIDTYEWTATWSGKVVLKLSTRELGKRPSFVVAAGSSVRWEVLGSAYGCTYTGSGDLPSSLLTGGLSIDDQFRPGLWGNNCTIGYGTLLHRGPCTAADRRLRWTSQQAEDELRRAVKAEYERPVRAFSRPMGLNQCQFDALVSFTYNVGVGAFRQLTRLTGAQLRSGWEAEIGQRLPRYSKSGRTACWCSTPAS